LHAETLDWCSMTCNCWRTLGLQRAGHCRHVSHSHLARLPCRPASCRWWHGSGTAREAGIATLHSHICSLLDSHPFSTTTSKHTP
jgi:hypothetical protein